MAVQPVHVHPSMLGGMVGGLSSLLVLRVSPHHECGCLGGVEVLGVLQYCMLLGCCTALWQCILPDVSDAPAPDACCCCTGSECIPAMHWAGIRISLAM